MAVFGVFGEKHTSIHDELIIEFSGSGKEKPA